MTTIDVPLILVDETLMSFVSFVFGIGFWLSGTGRLWLSMVLKSCSGSSSCSLCQVGTYSNTSGIHSY